MKQSLVAQPYPDKTPLPYAALPSLVAEAAAAGKVFLIFDGYINVREAQKALGSAHAYLAEVEAYFVVGTATCASGANTPQKIAGIVRNAGWSWGRYLQVLKVLYRPEHHPELPRLVSKYPELRRHWDEGMCELKSQLRNDWW